MKIENIAGYKFIVLEQLETLRCEFLSLCQTLALKGTILLSPEGINIFLAGTTANIASFKAHLVNDTRFADMSFRISYSENQPFKRMKVKIKNEIITMRHPEIKPTETRAPAISPAELKQWLDENRDITILDTRNEFEVNYGTFDNAVNLHINDFSQFPEASKQVAKQKPIVMFCTGGIRCEKAALHMLNLGYKEVYQLEGGILNYFEQVGGAHYHGGCFVFDERESVTA
jgi:UPF0176 protein